MGEYCALKAKMYSYIVAGEVETKKAKGVKKNFEFPGLCQLPEV